MYTRGSLSRVVTARRVTDSANFFFFFLYICNNNEINNFSLLQNWHTSLVCQKKLINNNNNKQKQINNFCLFLIKKKIQLCKCLLRDEDRAREESEKRAGYHTTESTTAIQHTKPHTRAHCVYKYTTIYIKKTSVFVCSSANYMRFNYISYKTRVFPSLLYYRQKIKKSCFGTIRSCWLLLARYVYHVASNGSIKTKTKISGWFYTFLSFFFFLLLFDAAVALRVRVT